MLSVVTKMAKWLQITTNTIKCTHRRVGTYTHLTNCSTYVISTGCMYICVYVDLLVVAYSTTPFIVPAAAVPHCGTVPAPDLNNVSVTHAVTLVKLNFSRNSVV